MSHDDKKAVVSIFDKHGKYSVVCLLELCKKCFIATKDFNSICVCVECASKEPAHHERRVPPAFEGVPTASEVVVAATSNTKLEAFKASTKGLNDGLNCFLVKPPGLKGKELFAHMVGVRLTNTKSTSPSKFLDVVVNTSNRAVLKDAAEASVSKRKIMRDAGGCENTGILTLH